MFATVQSSGAAATLALALTLAAFAAEAADPTTRSARAKREFRAAQPCPSAHATRTTCPGFVIDHIVPLCAGGADAPRNMQWQSVAEAKKKDRDEHAQCRAIRKERAKP